MADGMWHGTEKRATDGITFRSDLVLQAIGYKLISPSITCYRLLAIRSFS